MRKNAMNEYESYQGGLQGQAKCLDILSQGLQSLGRSPASWSVNSIELRNVLNSEAGIELFLNFVWLNTRAGHS